MGEAYGLRMGMPSATILGTGTPAFATTTIDAADDAIEFLMQAETTDAITHVGVRWHSVGATPGSYTIGIEGVTGAPIDPDGTYKGATNDAKLSFTPSATGFQWYALNESFTPTRGELFFITLKPNALPTNSSQISTRIDFASIETSLPRFTSNNSGSRSRLRNAMCFGYKTATRVYGRPLDAVSSTLFDSDTTPDEAGISWTIPSAFCYSYKVAGVRIYGRTQNGGKDFIVKLYTGSAADPDPVTSTFTIDGDAFDAAGSNRAFEVMFTDATLPTLLGGTQYRLTLQPATSTSDVLIFFWSQPSGESANWEAWQGGTWFAYTSRVNGGNFTDDADKRPLMELIISDVSQAPKATLTAGMQA